MNTQMTHWIGAGIATLALALGACGGDGNARGRSDDNANAGDGGNDGSARTPRGDDDDDDDDDDQVERDGSTADGGSARDGDGGGARPGDGGSDQGLDAGGNTPAADASMSNDGGSSSPDSGGGGQPGSDCEAKAKDDCEYQKKCDPVQFALEWDEDINKFCIPKRKAACERNLPLTAHRAIGDACNTWVRASCDNYRNFYYRVLDSNGAWQYGDPACVVTPKPTRENRALNEDCTSDYQCKDGLYCRVEADDYTKRDDADVERICGKCTAQFAYQGPNTSAGFYDDLNVCFRQEQCKTGYQCLRVYGTENEVFKSFDYSTSGVDLNHCVNAIAKVGRDKPCAKGSSVVCEDGLVCKGATEADIIGTCKPAEGATVQSYVGKDARCNPALCDPRLHLECKPVKMATATEDRCVPKAVAAIGGYCKNDKQEEVASCSQYARCVDNTGMCVRRNLESEACFPSTITPGANDRGSCDPNVYAEKPLVCRQDDGELAPKCHVALPQNMCSLPR